MAKRKTTLKQQTIISLEDVLDTLRTLGSPETVAFKNKKFGINPANSLGVYQKDLNLIVKEIGKNDALALELFDTGIYDAQILCSKIFTPRNLTPELMDSWVTHFTTWEICDSFSMKLFARSPFAVSKALEWSHRQPIFEKRAGFAMMAAYCMADKKAQNEAFEPFLKAIQRESWDERLYVRKAINWALRNIGKRNLDLKYMAIDTAHAIFQIKTKAAQWIANDALKELTKDSVRRSDYPRSIYRPKR
ncbi:MAG: 3-methyladenine DNA glycosylase AlkD [Bacteroidia bacterium]